MKGKKGSVKVMECKVERRKKGEWKSGSEVDSKRYRPNGVIRETEESRGRKEMRKKERSR